jgi:hypothetical protein
MTDQTEPSPGHFVALLHPGLSRSLAQMTSGAKGISLLRVEKTDVRNPPALEHSRGSGSLRLALASLRGYNRRLLYIPGAFPFPGAVLRNRRTSSLRSGTSLVLTRIKRPQRSPVGGRR